MKSLIAVVNARHRLEWREAIRRTWKNTVPPDRADVFFFQGRGDGPEIKTDEVILDCDDSYQGLPDKIREIARWAKDKNYSHFLKCDDDVVLKIPDVLDSGYDQFEYTGKANRAPTKEVPFVVPMGFNYWVSQRGMEAIAETELPENSNDDEKWVAGIMHRIGVELHDDQRYRLHYGYIVNRPLRINRPLRPNPNRAEPGEFSWCVFLEGNSGNRISMEYKISEFNKLFAENCSAKK